MPTLTSILATGALCAAAAFAQNVDSTISADTAGTTTALDAEAATDANLNAGPTGYTDGSSAATIATGTAGSGITTGYDPIMTVDPLLPPVNKPIKVMIDGTLYVPATTGGDYADHTSCASGSASTSWRPESPYHTSDIVDLPPTTTNTGDAGLPTGGYTNTGGTTLQTTTSAGDAGMPTGGYTNTNAGGTTQQTTTTTGDAGVPTDGYTNTGGTTQQATTTSTGDGTVPTGENPPAYSGAVAKVKLDASDDGSRQFDIPTDDTVTPILRGRGLRAEELTVLSAEDETIRCQAFNDKAGTIKLGKAVKVGKTGDVTKDGPGGEEVKVRSVKCGTVARPVPAV